MRSNHKVHFKTSPYEAAHGKKPSGRGRWAFELTGPDNVFFAPSDLLYSEAKKIAEAEERRLNPGLSLSIVKVLS